MLTLLFASHYAGDTIVVPEPPPSMHQRIEIAMDPRYTLKLSRRKTDRGRNVYVTCNKSDVVVWNGTVVG